MLAGACGGVGYWASCYPIDIIKTTIQSDHPDPSKRRYKGVVDAARQIQAEFGIKGFFRGFTPAIARSIPANAG
jgi:solute carrier family 25 carnitine/acylcarnitine transporter 20/29